MGDSLHPLGPKLGRLHAWRDRGSTYVDGFRTSAQFAFIAAGVAKGADFTGTAWAITLGLLLFTAIEGGKVIAGWLDDRFDIWRSHTQVVAEQNPIIMRQLAALERLSPVLGVIDPVMSASPALTSAEGFAGLPEHHQASNLPGCACSRQFRKHQTGCAQKLDGMSIRAVNVMLNR